MEPSESWYDRKKRKRPNATEFREWSVCVRNFGGLSHDGIVQFAARQWLCNENETFLITDMAKCPTQGSIAEATRPFRWETCGDHLQREANLFDLRGIVAVGGKTLTELRRRPWVRRHRLFQVIHYSPLAFSHHVRLLGGTSTGDLPLDKFLHFLAERRTLLDALKTPRSERRHTSVANKRSADVDQRAKVLLAVYRDQFTEIKRAANSDQDARLAR